MVAGLRRRRGTPFALRREACSVVAGLACAVRWFGGLQGWCWVGASCLHCEMLEGVGRVQCGIYGRAGQGIGGVSLVRRLLHVTGLRIAGEG
jgi:hypothetical protein